MEEQPAAYHAIIQGRVQGVGFRYFVLEQAQRLELTGWVRNRIRGEVEVHAEGSRPALQNLLIQLERGPSMADVTNITVEWLDPTCSYNKFNVAPTDW